MVDHFALMQQFLDSQRNLLGLLSGEAVATAEPTHGAPVAGPAARWPMLGQIETDLPELLICEREISLASDPYLLDHTLGGAPSARNADLTALPVIPYTFSMEMLAEAALRLCGPGKVVQGMQALRGYRWLTLDRDVLTLRLEARRGGTEDAAGRDTCTVRIYQRNDKGALKHVLVFEGQVLVGPAYPSPVSAGPRLGALSPSQQRDDELYAKGMFHGPKLRGVKHIRGWSEQGIEAELITLPTDGFFADSEPAVLAIDAGLLDAAGQLVGYWLSERFSSDFNCFPFEVLGYEQFAAPAPPGQTIICHAHIRLAEANQIEANLDLLDTQGRLIARLTGWRDRRFSMPERFYRTRLQPQAAFMSDPWPQAIETAIVRQLPAYGDELLEQSWGIWARVLAHLVLTRAERAAFNALPAEGRRRSDWLLARICAKDAVREWARTTHGQDLAPADVEIISNDRGKPVVRRVAGIAGPLPEVSMSHSNGLAVAALISPGGCIGVDVQRLRSVRAADVLAGGFDADEQAWLRARGVDENDPTRVIGCWCAKEAAAKAAGLGLEGEPKQWRVVAHDPLSGHVEVAHVGQVYRVQVFAGPNETLALCVLDPSENVARATASHAVPGPVPSTIGL